MKQIRQQIEEIADKALIYYKPETNTIVHESIIEKRYPDIDVETLLDAVDTHLDTDIHWNGVIRTYEERICESSKP